MLEEQRNELVQQQQELVERAWKDESFKQALKDNPRATIFDAFGITVPDNVNLTILEESDSEAYFVIPPKPVEVTLGELSDVELEVVAGGSAVGGVGCGGGCWN